MTRRSCTLKVALALILALTGQKTASAAAADVRSLKL